LYILDKNKDYYDYLKGIYGIDKTITYDRRGSVVLSEISLMEYISSTRFNITKSTEHFIVEIGDIQYLFRVEMDYKITDPITKLVAPYRGKFDQYF
jgi:hypothetical protein